MNTPQSEPKSCLLCGAIVARFGAWSAAHPDTGVCEECRARAKEPKDMPDIFEATTQLRSWQRQIIHGKNCFGEIADLIETIWKDRERVVMLYNKKCKDQEDYIEYAAQLIQERDRMSKAIAVKDDALLAVIAWKEAPTDDQSHTLGDVCEKCSNALQAGEQGSEI